MTSRGIIVAAISDLWFTTRVEHAARMVGCEVRVLRAGERLAEVVREVHPVCVIVSIDGSGITWDDVTATAQGDTPIYAHGSHKNVEALRQAKAAGCREIVSNGKFSKELPALLQRWTEKG